MPFVNMVLPLARRHLGAAVRPSPLARVSGGLYASVYDGTNDYFTIFNPNFAADGTKGLVSFWVYRTGGGVSQYFLSGAGGRVVILINADNTVNFHMETSAAVDVLDMDSGTALPANQWAHVLASWEAGVSAQLYVDDADDAVVNTNVAGSIDYNRSGVHGVGGSSGGGNLFNGRLAEFYFAFNTALDLDAVANRRLFIDADGLPAGLNEDGSAPTGSQPELYWPTGDPTNEKGSFSGTWTPVGAVETTAGPGWPF